MNNHQIILEGAGGQGLGLAGKIFAEAAVNSGLNAVQSQSYGAQARGGFSNTEIILGPDEIIFPILEEPDIIVALTNASYERYKNINPNKKLLVYDSNNTNESNKLKNPGTTGIFGFPFNSEVLRLKNPKGITLLAIGTLISLTGIIEPGYMEEAIKHNFTPSLAANNIECFQHGLNLVK